MGRKKSETPYYNHRPSYNKRCDKCGMFRPIEKMRNNLYGQSWCKEKEECQNRQEERRKEKRKQWQ